MRPHSICFLLICLGSLTAGCRDDRSVPTPSPAPERAGTDGNSQNADGVGIANDASVGTEGSTGGSPVGANAVGGSPGIGGVGGDDNPGAPDAGASNGAGGAGPSGKPDVPLVPLCVVGATRCATTGAVVEICTLAGGWERDRTCPFLCENGACAGTCAANDRRCGTAQTPDVCTKDGQWLAEPVPCPAVCTGKGVCTGECRPGEKKCGDSPNNLVALACDDQGQWVTKVLCPFLCTDGSCGGTCVPGEVRCVGNKTETCNAVGIWTSGHVCQGQTCVNGICRGVCEPNGQQCGRNNTPQICDPKGTWMDTTPCPGKTCVGGSCVGECASGGPPRCSPDKKFVQTCGATGVWMNGDVCGDKGCNFAVCNLCKPNGKSCEGKTLRTCNSAGTGWLPDEPCVVSCDSGNLTCINAIACNPACNAAPHCSGSAIVTDSCNGLTGQCRSTSILTCTAPTGGTAICKNGLCGSSCPSSKPAECNGACQECCNQDDCPGIHKLCSANTCFISLVGDWHGPEGQRAHIGTQSGGMLGNVTIENSDTINTGTVKGNVVNMDFKDVPGCCTGTLNGENTISWSNNSTWTRQ